MRIPPLVVSAADPGTDLSWLGPTVTAIGAVIVAGLGALGLIWRRRQDRQDAREDQVVEKQLTEKEEADEIRIARNEATKYYNLYRWFENAFFTVQGALRHLVRKVRDAHPDMELDADVVDALAVEVPKQDSK